MLIVSYDNNWWPQYSFLHLNMNVYWLILLVWYISSVLASNVRFIWFFVLSFFYTKKWFHLFAANPNIINSHSQCKSNLCGCNSNRNSFIIWTNGSCFSSFCFVLSCFTILSLKQYMDLTTTSCVPYYRKTVISYATYRDMFNLYLTYVTVQKHTCILITYQLFIFLAKLYTSQHISWHVI